MSLSTGLWQDDKAIVVKGFGDVGKITTQAIRWNRDRPLPANGCSSRSCPVRGPKSRRIEPEIGPRTGFILTGTRVGHVRISVRQVLD